MPKQLRWRKLRRRVLRPDKSRVPTLALTSSACGATAGPGPLSRLLPRRSPRRRCRTQQPAEQNLAASGTSLGASVGWAGNENGNAWVTPFPVATGLTNGDITNWFANMCMDARRNSRWAERTSHNGKIEMLPSRPCCLFLTYAKALSAHSISYASIRILRARSEAPVEAKRTLARNSESEHLSCPV